MGEQMPKPPAFNWREELPHGLRECVAAVLALSIIVGGSVAVLEMPSTSVVTTK